MANPFNVKFDSDCHDCGNTVEEGNQMFAHAGGFICEDCAENALVVCECGGYKKADFALCYECTTKPTADNDNWWPDAAVDKPKPKMDMDRALSFSQVSAFEYDPEEWYKSYVLGIFTSSKEMEFGSYVDKRIQTDPDFLPSLPRYEKMQHKMKVRFDGILIVGVPDGLDFDAEKRLADYKTGKKAWDKKRAKETGQLKFYLLLLYLTEKIKPEEFRCFIHWLPTQDNADFTISFVPNIEKEIKTFEVKHTMKEVLEYWTYVKGVYKKMQEYVENHA